MERIVLKPGRERSLINRHPWVFSGAVGKLPAAENGEIVEVTDSRNQLLGYGFFSVNSQITCRVFEFTDQETIIDRQYWIAKIRSAYQLRTALIDQAYTNMYRLLHAEGDFFPGVIVDMYAGLAVVQVLILGTERIMQHIVDGLHEIGIKHVYVKTKAGTQNVEEVTLLPGWIGEPCAMPVQAKENGITFLVDVEKGQKTGFFIDQRENRKSLGEYAKGKKVLNAFSYSGGFSLYALNAGATLVHSVDNSKEAIAMCELNVAANFATADHASFVEDVFSYLQRTTVDYDIMVLDPPAFAKNIRAVKNAAKGYKNLNLVAMKKIRPGGLIFTFSCSQHIDRDLFRKIVFGAAADAKRNVRILKQFTQPEDHPVNIFHPEGEYLKGLLLQVE